VRTTVLSWAFAGAAQPPRCPEAKRQGVPRRPTLARRATAPSHGAGTTADRCSACGGWRTGHGSIEICREEARSMIQPKAAPAAPTLGLRPAIEALPSSRIREIADAGMGRADLIPLWFGEPDTPTPKFICAAAAEALAAGDTFYQPNAGIAELRAALAAYMNGLYGTRLQPDNVIVSASAMNALKLVMQALVDPGDVVVTTTPSWPNLPALPQILSGR